MMFSLNNFHMWCCGVVILFTAQLHSKKSELDSAQVQILLVALPPAMFPGANHFRKVILQRTLMQSL